MSVFVAFNLPQLDLSFIYDVVGSQIVTNSEIKWRLSWNSQQRSTNFDALLRSNLYRFLYVAYLHPTFLSDRFKCLTILTNFHFSLTIKRSCMIATNYISCWCIVSVFSSYQYCICIAKNVCAMRTNRVCNAHKMLFATSCFKIQEN